MKQRDNIIFTGPTGTGKSYLAQSIGVKACEMLHKVIYYPMGIFTDTVQMMQLQGNYQKWINRVKIADVLIIDDFGLTSIDDRTRKALMEIIDYRYDQSSIILISQIPVKDWHGLIGENTIADAIMDRITHNSHRITLNGESVRKFRKNVAVPG
jgi:DNA replication protein DnaC